MQLIKLFFWCLILSYLPSLLQAQDSNNDPASSMLPDINPQDIEIKGDYRIRFPGLRRQPILGFDPKPRVYQLDPNRLPFLETSDQIVASIPLSPLQIPESPVRNYRAKIDTRKWWLLSGYGLYNAPELELGYENIKSGDSQFSLFTNFLQANNLNLNNSESFQNANIKLNYSKLINKGYQWETVLDSRIQDTFVPFDTSKSSSSEYTSVRFKTGLRSIKNAWQHWKFFVHYNFFNQNSSISNNSEMEHFFGLQTEKFWAMDTPRTGMGIGFKFDGSDYQVANTNQNYVISHLYWRYQYLEIGNKSVFVGIDPYYTIDNNVNRFLIYPTIEFEQYHFYGATLRVSLKGEVTSNNRNLLQTRNRFLSESQELQINRGIVGSIHFEKEILKRSSLYGGIDLKRYTNFGFFDYQVNTNNVLGNTPVEHVLNFDQVQLVKFKAGMVQHLKPNTLSWNTEVWWLNHRLENGDPIPYLERLGVESSLLFYIQDNWYIQGEGQVLIGRDGFNTSSNLVLINAKTRYAFNKNWAVYLKVLNLTGTENIYWSELQEWPLFLIGGINLIF